MHDEESEGLGMTVTSVQTDYGTSSLAGSTPEYDPPASPGRRKDPAEAIFAFAASVILFTQVPSVVKVLFNKNPSVFTACSILCAGNMVSVVWFPILFWKDLTIEKLSKVTKREVVALFTSSLLYSAIGPALQLRGLETTSVALSSAIQRLETVNLLLFTYWVSGDPISTWNVLNGIAIIVCVITFCIVNDTPLGNGALYILSSGWAFSFSLVITKSELSNVLPGHVACARAILGTIFYHIFAAGEETLAEVYSIELWKSMIWYGFIYVVIAQYLWVLALQSCKSTTIAVGITTQFPLQLVWAFLFLGDIPPFAQIAVSVVLVIVAFSGAMETVVMGRRGEYTAEQADRIPLKGI
eukprot:TRINITY_DN22679_c0_g1_i1.p1 TRINITY_DN22679_c0_g1~~TRINITY_DN22679_c0_g1_i1.p1  ORF type:complete len:355 (+),score=43.81 TRINITY_DN22679_c0_g1_i1:78-1142(+)